MSTREPRHQGDRPKPPATTDLIRRLADEVQYRSKRKQKSRKRKMARFGKAARLLLLVMFVVNPAVLTAGLVSSHFLQAVALASGLFLTSFAGLLIWILTPKAPELPAPKVPQLESGKPLAGLALLPAQTDEWLYDQRSHLPHAAQSRLDSIGMRLEALASQLQGVGADVPGAAELRRLLGDELPELVRGYRKVPRALQQQPLHGGLSPERQLMEGLATIDVQIGRLQETLASDDMRALATHQRFLDLKYKRDDELE